MTRFRTVRNVLAIAMLVFSLGAGLLAAPISSARQNDGADPLVTLYFLRDGRIGSAVRPIAELPQDISIWDASLIALFAGPRDDEHAAGLRTALLPATALAAPVALDANTGVATVDLHAAFVQDMAGRASAEIPWRMAQIVATLTQFPEIAAVAFRLDGQPLPGRTATGEETTAPTTRADIEDLTPLILLERPGVWQQVASPLRLTGTANTFEAVVSWRLVDRDGAEIGSGWFMATSGSGIRGTFDETIPVDAAPGRATLVLFEESAMDGSPVNVVSIPIEIVAPGAAAAPATAAGITGPLG